MLSNAHYQLGRPNAHIYNLPSAKMDIPTSIKSGDVDVKTEINNMDVEAKGMGKSNSANDIYKVAPKEECDME